jgi:gentisate 1,2-dioxygenase
MPAGPPPATRTGTSRVATPTIASERREGAHYNASPEGSWLESRALAFRDAPDLDALHARLAEIHVTAGWNKLEPSLYPEPKPGFEPMHWRWEECKAAIDAAGRLIDTREAERRNLVLFNPADPKQYATTRTLVTAYQMILPGEQARTHRHTPHALRLVLEGEGAYTVVDGARLEMSPGDVVLTPGGCWHGHGNDGAGPCYWLDGLDIPLAHLLEPVFFEPHPEGFARTESRPAASPCLFHWRETRARLAAAPADPEGWHGPRIELGSPALPTTSVTMQRLPAGFTTRPLRTTANQIFCVVDGRGVSTIGGRRIRWSRGDVFAAPCWRPLQHEAASEATLFCMSDEPVQRFCGYLRTEPA